jgi:hypothetical protein
LGYYLFNSERAGQGRLDIQHALYRIPVGKNRLHAFAGKQAVSQ